MSGSDTDIEVIKDEVLWLLIACYVIKSMDTDPGVKFETRWGIGNWLFSRTTVFESIIMRACRLDDDSPSNWSFRTAQKRLNSEIKDQKRISNIIRLTKQYRQEINQIKVYIRNNGLAHIPINEKPEITEFNPVPFLKCGFHAIRTLSPPTSGHPFHAHPDRQSERSNAGLHC
jgi:hypothetical protein